MTDVSHHHLAFGVIAIIGGHMYRTNYGIGHSMKEILEAHQGDPILFPAPKGHQGLFEFMAESRHAQLAVNLSDAWFSEYFDFSSYVCNASISIHCY